MKEYALMQTHAKNKTQILINEIDEKHNYLTRVQSLPEISEPSKKMKMIMEA